MRRLEGIRCWAFVGAALLACDAGPPPGPVAPPAPEWTAAREAEAESHELRLAAAEPGPGDALGVHLGFGPEADLDLYVTGPLEETVYYANTPSRIGGALEEDRRCVHEGPRTETVRFPAPLVPGRYRVGVDYPRACGEAEPVPFAVRIEKPGGASVVRGLARQRVFDPIVLEFEIPAAQPEAKP